jgi:hypothetical protein
MARESLRKSSRTLKSIHRARQATAAISVWNASDEAQTVRFKGMPYTFQPGLTEVKDLYGFPRDVEAEARKNKRELTDAQRTWLIATAVEIVTHAETRLSRRGVGVVTGNAAEDAEMKKQLHRVWMVTKSGECRQVREGYNRRTLAFSQNPQNLGKQPPPMNERELVAEKWLNRAEGGVFETKQYVCPFACGFHDDDKADFDLHIRVAHPGQAAPAAAVAQAPARAPRAARAAAAPAPTPAPAKAAGKRGRQAQAGSDETSTTTE